MTASGRLGSIAAQVVGRRYVHARRLGPQLQGGYSSSAAAASGTHFDYLVLGAGSGGMASARRAAEYGAKVAVVESGRLGGTCVNVGCVPKKVMWNAAFVKEVIEGAADYGHDFDHASYSFDWGKVKASRDSYVTRLNGIYERNLDGSGVTLLRGEAAFSGSQAVTVGGVTYTAEHVLVAVGGQPVLPADVPGAVEHGIDSDGFFELDQLPKKTAVIGAGYIAVELAGVLNTLGSDVDLFVRGDGALRRFDTDIASFLNDQMASDGVRLVTQSNLLGVEKQADGTLTLQASVGGEAVSMPGYDSLLFAVGRSPNVQSLRLELAGVVTEASGHITVDEYQNTSADGVYALGDVCGVDELTPVAIAAGRRLADRLFGGPKHSSAKIKYGEVPTVVFSHPPIGTIGLTEAEAAEKYGADELKVYTSTFVNMFYAVAQLPPSEKPRSFVKLICAGEDEAVVGLHVIGMAADEMVQGFGVAMRMGATKADFDNCIAIHPTASEEIVTLAPWGKSPPSNWPINVE